MKLFSLIKKQGGAMFGMDARIALAVLGTLSIAAGYLGVSKLTAANRSVILKELDTLDQAVRQLQADIGTFYMFGITTSNGINDINALVDSGQLNGAFQARWQGPYVDKFTQDHVRYGEFSITYAQGDHTTACTFDSECFAWIRLSDVPANVWSFVNTYVDEDHGRAVEADAINQGIVHADAATDPRVLIYRSAAR